MSLWFSYLIHQSPWHLLGSVCYSGECSACENTVTQGWIYNVASPTWARLIWALITWVNSAVKTYPLRHYHLLDFGIKKAILSSSTLPCCPGFLRLCVLQRTRSLAVIKEQWKAIQVWRDMWSHESFKNNCVCNTFWELSGNLKCFSMDIRQFPVIKVLNA